ncbi:MAG: KOW domain-containing RNA-binding protein [Clostridia bacterium]|nr:KOW domain-containing RNA-binding protein [Clostridia bacterium]
MDICKGMLVYSRAGRDKGKIFIVLKTENDFVYLSDGKTRHVANPKKKKIKHIMRTNTVLKLDFDSLSDSDVKKAILDYFS